MKKYRDEYGSTDQSDFPSHADYVLYRKHRVREIDRRNSSPCFIATAAYGIDARETNILRRWRNESLNRNPFGRQLVKLYYAISPKAVKVLNKYPISKELVKTSLDYLVSILGKNLIGGNENGR